MKNMQRRDFIIGSLTSLGSLAFLNGRCDTVSPALDDEIKNASDLNAVAYNVAVLGDTHYDTAPETVYHAHYDESNIHSKVQHAEFKRNGEMWRERCPRLLASSAALAHENKTDFILQLGDIIQGDCDHIPTHQKMLDDCIKMLKKPYPGDMPFLTVVGNHDFRGKGAIKAYFDFAHPFMTKEIEKLTGKKLENPVRYPILSFRKGPDLWILCHFEKANLNKICDIIDDDVDARHVFVVTHGPFTTYANTKSYRWRLGGSPRALKSRQRLFDTLSKRRGIVLSGHTHSTTYYRFENNLGSFCEFTGNSVWTEKSPLTATPNRSTPEQYIPAERFLNKIRNKEDFHSEINFFKPSLKEYYETRAAGHYRLKVAENSVEMEFYLCDSRTPDRVFKLK